jgi:hypothetical protein
MEELDVVALTIDRPDLGLKAGQTGTIVSKYSEHDFHIEFVNNDGWTYALADLPRSQLLKLVYDGCGTGVAAA